jgi:thiosulfate reductase cytochrome b subunit
MPRREQPWPIRLTHWLNVPLLGILAGSGLQILMAYPMLGPRGAEYPWDPLRARAPPEFLGLGGWLAGGRHWHFAFAGLLVLNGLVYLGYLFGSGEWRRRLFWPRRDAKDAVRTAAYYLRLSRAPPLQAPYNGLQRLAYTASLAIAAITVLAGLAIYKPIQLAPLTAWFGGYDAARAVHFFGLLALAAFTAGHVAMVAAHRGTLKAMIVGGARVGDHQA